MSDAASTTIHTDEELESAQHPANLRALADILERSQLPGSVHAGVNGLGKPEISVFTYDIDDLREARRIVGACDKREKVTGGFRLEGRLAGIPVTIYPPSGVCKRVQVGTETVEREEVIEPAKTRMVTEEVPVYEWDCGPVLVDEPEAVTA